MSTQSTPPDQEFLEADLDVDDGTLVREYDVGDGVAESIFGALDTGGFEDEDEDESWRTLRMTLKTMVRFLICLFFLLPLRTHFQQLIRDFREVCACQRLEEQKPIGGQVAKKLRNRLSSRGS
jgi:hypothetical protein